MAENINFIPATDLPVAEGDEVSVLCVENGEMKQKPASGLGGGETPDMVITVTGKSSTKFADGNYSITKGSVDNVFAAFHAGRYPIIKVRFYNGENTDYMASREECDAFVCTYGECLWFSFIALNPYESGSLYYHKVYMNSDGTLANADLWKATLTVVT